MAEFDNETQRLTLKVVFYGPALSGKTTNLTRLHDLLGTDLKGEMMVLETQNDCTLFFDLLPLGLRAPSGLLIKLKLFTVPGQTVHDSTRKAVLSRADGVVFVADSQTTQIANNAESFHNLEQNATRVGLDFANLPMVVQFNKRDLQGIVPKAELKQLWSGAPWPLTFASALQGEGVIESFAALLNQLYDHLDPHYALLLEHQLDRQGFCDGLLGPVVSDTPGN
ncbi:MAG: GTPase domain-containing protein [Pseudomonadota bacterium]|nr:GTPase domain-containing protein [Pseudomonadota bacterium]